MQMLNLNNLVHSKRIPTTIYSLWSHEYTNDQNNNIIVDTLTVQDIFYHLMYITVLFYNLIFNKYKIEKKLVIK